MRIRDSSLLADLEAHFARAGFVVRARDGTWLDVERDDAPDESQSRREVAAHLLVWRLMHPRDPGEILEDAAGNDERPGVPGRSDWANGSAST